MVNSVIHLDHSAPRVRNTFLQMMTVKEPAHKSVIIKNSTYFFSLKIIKLKGRNKEHYKNNKG